MLRELGFRYVPCLLTDPTDDDASDVLLPATIKQNRQFYLQTPRPPLFNDCINPRLTSVVPVTRKNYVFQAKMDLQRMTVPAL